MSSDPPAGWHPQGRVHSHLRRPARALARQRAALRRLGDLSPQRLAGRSEPASTPRKPAAGSGRSSSAPTTAGKHGTSRAARRRADHHARWHAQGRKQQVRLRHVARNRQAAHHAPVVRRHAASVGVQAGLAPGAVAHRSRHRLRRRRRRGPVPHDRRRQDVGTNWPGSAATAPGRSGRPAPAAWACTRSCSIRTNPETDLRRHLRGRRLPHRRRRQHLEADQPRAAVASTSPTPTPRSATASIASPCTRRGPTCSSCRSIGT